MAKLLLGVALAIGITALLDATGYTVFSALPLAALFAGFAWLGRHPRSELGLTMSRGQPYLLALGHPLLVMGALVALAQASGALDLANLDAAKAAKNVAILTGATFVMAIITEEGFFRGWLWSSLARLRVTPIITLFLTSAAFWAWHLPFAFVSGFDFVPAQIPIFLLNVFLLGMIWGLLRLGSGSIIVSSAGHGLWNGLAYVLFGVGDRVGALGIKDIGTYGPEVGVFGAILNALFAGWLAWLYRDKLFGAGGAGAKPAIA